MACTPVPRAENSSAYDVDGPSFPSCCARSPFENNLFTFRLLSALIFLAPAPVIVLFLPYAAAVKIGVFIAVVSFLFITLNQILPYHRGILIPTRLKTYKTLFNTALTINKFCLKIVKSGGRGIWQQKIWDNYGRF